MPPHSRAGQRRRHRRAARFAVSSPVNPSPFLLTAGHCMTPGTVRSAQRANGRSVDVGPDVGGFVTGDLDAGVIQVTNIGAWPTYPAVLNWIDTWGTTPVLNVAPSQVGFFYCHTGAGSPLYGHTATTCGTNRGVTTVNYTGYPTLTLQYMQGDMTGWRGDSGGPVFDWGAGHAVGIWSGAETPARADGSCGTAWRYFYTEAGHAASVLNVTINHL